MTSSGSKAMLLYEMFWIILSPKSPFRGFWGILKNVFPKTVETGAEILARQIFGMSWTDALMPGTSWIFNTLQSLSPKIFLPRPRKGLGINIWLYKKKSIRHRLDTGCLILARSLVTELKQGPLPRETELQTSFYWDCGTDKLLPATGTTGKFVKNSH